MCKNLSAKHYEVNKKRMLEKACERYQNLSEEKEKIKIWLLTFLRR